jgi:anthranilate phosphoribosyltransferase
MGRSGIALVGHSGLDDVDLSGPALLVHAASTPVTFDFDPSILDLPSTPIGDVPGGGASVNAELFRLLFDDGAPLPLRQLVCLSASVALIAAKTANSYTEAYAIASELLSSGKAKAKFLEYREAARACGN